MEAAVKECIRVLEHCAVHFCGLPNFPIDGFPSAPFFRNVGARYLVLLFSKGVDMSYPQPEGFLAAPPSGKGQGVLVLHAWWGLNETIKSVCSLLADEGFVAFAPDLYHGKIADTIPGAEALMKALGRNPEQAQADIREAIQFLAGRLGKSNAGLAAIGFSLGAAHALDHSASDPGHIRSVVVFYGTTGGVDFTTSRASYLGHFAEKDDFEERPYIDELEQTIRSAGRPVTFHHYPGTGHWFAEPDRKDAYNHEAATLAWNRTLKFLKRDAKA
jgi:carboxymethylenebutenolidase